MSRLFSSFLKYLVLIIFFGLLIGGAVTLCVLLASFVFAAREGPRAFGIGMVFALSASGLAMTLALGDCE